MPASTPADEAEGSRVRLALWLEMAEFALDNAPERVDTLLELCESLETAWLAACAAERTA